MAIDPVCAMTVNEKTAVFRTEHNGTTYYFCRPGCKAAFDRNPEKYLKAPKEYPHIPEGGPLARSLRARRR